MFIASSGGQMRGRAECDTELRSEAKGERANWRAGGRPAGSFPSIWRSHAITRGIVALTLVVTLCGSVAAFGQNQKNKKKSKEADANENSSLLPENQAVDGLVSQMLGAWQAGDAPGMHKFYADDVTVISGAWEPPLMGWANYARAYEAQFARTSGCRLERTNSLTKVMGDSAMVTYQWQFIGDVDGRRTQAFGHTTLVLQKRAGTWLIVLNHTSAVPSDEPAAEKPASAGQPASSPTANAK
jgi:uncharacterized protein (TIGR02246 family)